MRKIQTAETTEVDFKLEVETRKPKSWLKSVSAFANGIGGTLLFGVDDTGKVIGLDAIQEKADKISELIKTKIDPVPVFILTSKIIDEKEILSLVVHSGHNTPYYYSNDGNNIAYIRIGNESVQTNASMLNELILKGKGQTYDSLPTQYLKSDFSFTLFEATFRQQTNIRIEPEDYYSFGLTTIDNYLTNTGLLLADQSVLQHSRLFCTRWNGLAKGSIFDDAIDDKEFAGNLIYLLQSGASFCKTNTKIRWGKLADRRIEKPDYPERAVFEALVNSLIHRDYLILGSEVHIDIYDDRMTIISPGGMYDGRLIQNLDVSEISSNRRNPVIADVFHRLQYMERRGSGLRKIKDEYQKSVTYNQSFEPKFESSHSHFCITIYNLNFGIIENNKDSEDIIRKSNISSEKVNGVVSGVVNGVINGVINEELKVVFEFISLNEGCRKPLIAEKTTVPIKTIDKQIIKLREMGKIEFKGANKTGGYYIKNLG